MTEHPQEHASLDAFVAKVEASGEDKKHEAPPEFEFWWADHCPNATQAEAWAEWCELHSVGDSFKFTPHAKYGNLYTQAQRDAYAAEAVKQERKTQADDYWTLICAVENMRSADRNEATVEARWQLAFKLAQMAERIAP